MFRKVDCIRLHVPNLEEALSFYRNMLGHELVWRRGNESAGLRMDESDTEIVLVSEGKRGVEVDLLVDSVDEAVREIEKAGGKMLERPFDIPVGRCSVVEDPWKNRLVVLDLSKGLLKTDAEGNVLESK